jgi:hypothetical protein
MTVILSFPSSEMIIMTADSRKTTVLNQLDVQLKPIPNTTRVEFTSTQKIFPIPGIGCISMWGDITRSEKSFPNYLSKHLPGLKDVDDLRILVDNYLHYELQAHLDGEDIGFHVGGFALDQKPRLYHVFYGLDRPFIHGQKHDYRAYAHQDLLALYNGRNDLVAPIMRLLIDLQEQVGIAIFDNDPAKRLILADFVTRYIAQFTPDVGGQIHSALIMPKNFILHVVNNGRILVRSELEKILKDNYYT